MLTTQSIFIHGYLVGALWGGHGWKPLHADITRTRRRRGFYDAVKDLTDDGDFQRCEIAGDIVITMREMRRGRLHTVTQTLPLSFFPSLDCLMAPVGWTPTCEDYDSDDERSLVLD